MYESIARRELAKELASPNPMQKWHLDAQVAYAFTPNKKTFPKYSKAPKNATFSKTCTNYSYIIRNILLRNMNDKCYVEKSGNRTDDYILRPVALLDIALRDLQQCESWNMTEDVRKLYRLIMMDMHDLFRRFYRHMGEEQIYMLSEAMEKMEKGIQHDYDVLKFQVRQAMTEFFNNDENLTYESILCVIHVCLDLPRLYMQKEFEARFEELENASQNVNILMHYYATMDDGTEADIDLNRCEMVAASMKAFSNRFYFMKMVEDMA